MSDAKLDLTAQGFTADQLAIKVKNISGAALDKPMILEITLPRVLLSQTIRDKADKAPRNNPPISNLDDDVKGAEGKFSVWAEPETSDHFATIMFLNDFDNKGLAISPMVLTAGAEFTVLIPLDPAAHRISIDLPYGYEYDNKARIDGKLELKVEESDWTPEVTLWTDHASPTAIEPMTGVKIEWKIKNGVSAILRGPLPGGNTEWSLSDSSTSSFKMSKGSFVIIAVGSMTYMLQAEVEGPPGRPNMQVARMLSIDTSTKGKYGYLKARPERVLPFGLVELDWAAWGVKAVRITAPGTFREFKLTDMTLSGFAQGTGVVRTTARKTDSETPIFTKLYIEIERTMHQADEANYMVIPWTKMEKPKFTGKPLGLAVAAPKMALLTTDGLWIAKVGEFDASDGVNDLEFIKVNTDKPKAWLAIAALGDKFVALRQTDQNDLQVELYKSNGTLDEIPPLDLKPHMGSGPVFDFVVYDKRAYVVVESLFQTGRVRRAFSVGFDSSTRKAEYRNEFLLERLPGYRLLTFDDALFALDRESGQMLRLVLKDGKLEPYKAASAVADQGASMVKQGLLVSAGRVLAVLSPTSVPSLASLAGFGLRNVLPYKNLGPLQDASTVPQDLIYSPLNDRWSRCGHGLDIKEGVVAFRGGESPRLWVIDPNGETFTLTGATEDLFLPDYVKDLPSKPLPPVFNKKRELAFVNNTGMQFVPMNETCFKANLRPFSATGLVYLSSPLPTGPTSPKRAEPVELRYNDVAPGSAATLCFLAQRGPGVKHEYVLEVTLSAPPFSFATIGFKRITVDAQGGVSVVEVPGKLQTQLGSGLIEVFPRQLTNGLRLRVLNGTPYTLWLRSPHATDPADHEKKYLGEAIKIRYDTPPFSIYAHGAGELPVDVDFTLPSGIEISPSSAAQKNRIRIKWDGPQIFDIESAAINETNEYDTYEFTLRYKVEKKLSGAYLGDGVASNDGESIYLPLAEPPNVTNAKILKIDANNLQTTAQASVTGRSIFSCPNSVAVLSDRVVAIFNREQMNFFDHDLKSKPGLPIALFEYNIITKLKGLPGNGLFTLGMKEQPTWQFKFSYKYDGWIFEANLHHWVTGWVFFPSERSSRVPGAPFWVAPNTISPMDVRLGASMAICVEGGILAIDLNNSNQIAVELPGTGREEAIYVDPTEHIIFSAHSKASGPGLMISRINPAKPSEKLTIEIPGPVYHVVTDLKPPAFPNLEYYRPRAASLLATSDTLFVSHGRKIYVLDKTRLTQRQNIELNLPLRLIQVRRGKPAGENHPKYSVPHDHYLVWAIGSRYAGDGQTVKVNGQDFETSLYKIAILQ